MRIIAGRWRGRPLVAPPGAATRPTADRVREALFSMLASRLGSFDGLEVADLFAGSGALGLEALSRGAAHCTFVDSDRSAAAALRRNVERCGAAAQAEILLQSVQNAATPARPCDLVFLDPPYGSGFAAAALDRLADPAWTAPGALVSLETAASDATSAAGWEIEADRRYGKARIRLLRRP